MKLLDDPKVFLTHPIITTAGPGRSVSTTPDYGMFCPACGGLRRMNVSVGPSWHDRDLYVLTCTQCDSQFSVLVYPGPGGETLAVLPSVIGGLRTAHTPEGVAFYLDQAHRAQSVGAYSAAVAMFRGALEHVLHDAGYTTGMLGAKLGALSKDVAAGNGPKWARELDGDFLDVLKELGNGAIHPNDGDVKKQEAIDVGIMARVQTTFMCLLDLAYEVDHRKAELLGDLKRTAAALKR